MTAQKGRDLLLKIADGAGGYVTVAGIRARRVSLNASTIDVTDSLSAGQWRELLAGGGIRRAGLTGSGIFRDAASDETIRQAFFEGALMSWQVIVPDFGILSGAFQITTLDYGGRHDGEVTFEITLESAGEIQFETIV